MFFAKATHLNFLFQGYMANGKVQVTSNALNSPSMVDFGQDMKYWDKTMNRMAHGGWTNVYNMVDGSKMHVHISLDNKIYKMQINVVAIKINLRMKNALHEMAYQLFLDWVYNGAMSVPMANTMAWQAGVAPLSRFNGTGTTFVPNGILE